LIGLAGKTQEKKCAKIGSDECKKQRRGFQVAIGKKEAFCTRLSPSVKITQKEG
jgi:hypothetical protein